MKVRISLLLLLFVNLAFSFQTENLGKNYDIVELSQLCDSLNYNHDTDEYFLSCPITVMENDTLTIGKGTTIRPNSTVYYWDIPKFLILGCIRVMGTEDYPVTIGYPLKDYEKSWKGIVIKASGEEKQSVFSHAILQGFQSGSPIHAIWLYDSSPIIDYVTFQHFDKFQAEIDGNLGISCTGNSSPLITNCIFKDIDYGAGIAFFYHSDYESVANPTIINCDFYKDVAGYYSQFAPYTCYAVVGYGGFLDNCYLETYHPDVPVDLTLGDNPDEEGDGIFNTSSTCIYPRYWMLDGVTNPRSKPNPVGIKDDILPTTSKTIVLHKNYPNPFNPETTIEYEIINSNSPVSIQIYNSNGELVKTLLQNKVKAKGKYAVKWNATDNMGKSVPSGAYFYYLRSGNEVQVKQAILVK